VVIPRDEPLAELETDKVTLGVAAPISGTLSQILVAEGQTVAVGGLLAHVVPGESGAVARSEEKDDPAPAEKSASSEAPSTEPFVFPAARKLAEEHGLCAT